MALEVEQFAEYAVDAQVLWAVVGDPARLPEWTGLGPPVVRELAGADAAAVPVDAWRVGDRVLVRDGDSERVVEVLTAQRGVVEVATDTACGRVGVGVRVVGESRRPMSRLVVAGRLEPVGGSVRARVLDLPRLRRRFDAWAAGLRAAVGA